MKSKSDIKFSQSFARQIPQREQSEQKKLRRVLKQCYFVLKDLKERNRILEIQLTEKNTIIDKITQEKQSHILHMSTCNSQVLKRQLQQSVRRSDQIKKSYEKTFEHYEQMIRKCRLQNERLIGFNKVLRIQNSHLRQKVSKQKTWRQRQITIGKITSFKTPLKSKQQQVTFFRTKNPSESQYEESNNLIKEDLITPEKFKTSKSTNLSSTFQKNTLLTYSQDLSQKQQYEPRNLFHNPALRKLSSSIQKQSIPEDSHKLHSQNLVNIWFQRLRNLLDDSDEEQ